MHFNNFIIQNVKEGKYLIIALEEESKDYTFQSKVDKIGFTEGFIQLPEDSIINISVFKEKLPFKIGKPKQKTSRSFSFGYEGEYEPFNVKIITQDSFNYKSKITREKKSDSLIFWLKSEKKLDSITFNVYNDNFSDTLSLNLRNKIKGTISKPGFKRFA